MTNNYPQMRTIKFRAWVREVGKLDRMIYPGDEEIIIFSTNGIFVDSEAYSIQQFTGLLDKNGKEIYEGDIVKGGRYMMNDNEVVEFERGGFIPFAIHGWEGSEESEDVEVIGNIYENPKLLTKTN